MQSLEVDLLLRACQDEEDTIHQIVNLLEMCIRDRFVLCSHRIEKPADTTICFEKGKVYNVGVLTLKSNDTV